MLWYVWLLLILPANVSTFVAHQTYDSLSGKNHLILCVLGEGGWKRQTN